MDLHPIFAACCGRTNGRYPPREPWNAGGFVYATDSSIVVRQPTTDPDSRRESGSFPDALSVYTQSRQMTYSPVVLPAAPPDVVMEICHECKGKKAGPFPCEHCYGQGQARCFECGHYNDCPDCDGTGYSGKKGAPCDVCNGAGELETVVPCQFPNGWTIQSRYLRMLIEHNAALEIPSDLTRPGRFTIGEIVGLVMPVIRRTGQTYPTEVTITETGTMEVTRHA